ncbi:MAG: hypothetical protein L7H00_05235 [Vulcanisaeta sp.]|nr:hypothetical protein [Vulcanisaeta sp.]MCG2892921.1 hypothetical protein [Vulcanisaeta sp.]MCG2895582.1 hypothetical protein [Vulcanisaeta sp.]
MRLPYSSIAAMLISGLVIGAGVPIALFYMAFKVGTWPFLLAAAILGALAIFWGAVMAIVAFAPVLDSVDEQVNALNRQLNTYRAFIRALLEELDDVNAILKDIRDELRRVGE